MNPTTRRFPRSMREAFPGEVDYACPIERTARRPSSLWLIALLVALVAACAVIALPEDAVGGINDAGRQAIAQARRERAEARMCIREYGIGTSVVRDVNDRTVCVPRIQGETK